MFLSQTIENNYFCPKTTINSHVYFNNNKDRYAYLLYELLLITSRNGKALLKGSNIMMLVKCEGNFARFSSERIERFARMISGKKEIRLKIDKEWKKLYTNFSGYYTLGDFLIRHYCEIMQADSSFTSTAIRRRIDYMVDCGLEILKYRILTLNGRTFLIDPKNKTITSLINEAQSWQ